MITRHYVNLSNGIEALEGLPKADVRFMRLQSTSCEHKHWDRILDGLPDDFLLSLAAGEHVIVHDRACSDRAQGLSWAQWQGIDWVRYALARADWGLVTNENVYRSTFEGYWREVWQHLPDATVGRLRWYSRWVRVDTILLTCEGGIAQHDGDSVWHRKTWSEWHRRIG